MHLTYETSRGCWWGQKSHCTFCGLNGQGMRSRNKSPDRAIAELQTLVARHGVKRVAMTDNIMPHDYFTTVLRRLPREVPGVAIMYEEKANLRLDQVRALVAAGVVEIQPGIEAISTGLLKLMAKGTTAAQNLALLRYAKATGLLVQWNLLHGCPNDELAFYEETLELMPFVHHLQPPVSPCPVVIDRFSPYFERPEHYGVRDVRPFGFYRGVYGEDVPLAKLAYHFEGTYASVTRDQPALVKQLAEGVAEWRRRFYGPVPPRLVIERAGTSFKLIDTRGLPGTTVETMLDADHAVAAAVTRAVRSVPADLARWLLDAKLVVPRDGKLIALAVAEPELLAELEARGTQTRGDLRVVS
jgi:ribosomal peptide maturation radical SAM protein 1